MTDAKLDKKLELIKLRAMGKSYQAIANELQISKQTAINWATESRGEIEQAIFIEVQNMLETMKQTKKDQLQTWLNQLKLVNESIEEKLMDKEGVNFSDLIRFRDRLADNILAVMQSTNLDTGKVTIAFPTDKISLLDW